jgi:DNA helicase HerA-like ATPase
MATPGTAGPLRFEPRSEPWSAEFVRRLASLGSASPFGTGWLVERRTDRSGVVVLPGNPVAAEVVLAAAAGLPARIAPTSWEWLGCPSQRDRFAVVSRRGWGIAGPEEIEPSPRAPAVAPASASDRGFRIDLDPPVGAVQAHWFSTGRGRLACRLRYWSRAEGARAASGPSALAGAAVARLLREGVPVEVRELTNSFRRRRAWASGGVAGLRAGPFERLRAEVAAAVVLAVPRPAVVDDAALSRHVVVVGASGSGKSSWLAGLATERVERGAPVVVFDLHGDLGPRIASQLSPGALRRLVAIDAAGPPDGIPGVRLLGAVTPNEREREAAHLVAALKRLTGESGDVYWGYRLERTFDTFVRLVQEEGGGLRDLYELLVDARRRDAARLATRLPAVAAFLDELPALLRRNAEFLAPSAGRVAKVALSPAALRLLDPEGAGLPVAALLGEGRSIVWRLPFAAIGPETAAFAATLLASHVYLGLAADGPRADGRGVLMVLDEASAISPRLLAEMLAEGRKFGVGVLLATQYPGRLAPEARAAAEGAAGTHVVFRVPAPVARFTAEWAGLDRASEPILESLPDGVPLVVRSGDGGGRGTIVVPPPTTERPDAWGRCVDLSAAEHAEAAEARRATGPSDGAEALLLALAGGPAEAAEWVARAAGIAGVGSDPAALTATIASVLGRGWAESHERTFHLTEAGARYLGVGRTTGASTESAQHRALLFTAFAIFARRGVRLEFVRQGRYDRRLPDGMVRQLPASSGAVAPAELARRIDHARRGWAWRFFDGRDVDVEAEVSGAMRADRIRRNLEKARARRCFALFLVADPARARRIRGVLRDEGAGPREAQVWTLRRAGAATAQSDAAGDGAAQPPDRASEERWSISSATA